MSSTISPLEIQPAAAPRSSIEREVRFAVVIYGGVSLTVYINGIVQEMLNMVLSTAEAGSATKPLTALQGVYRELACLVGEPAPHDAASHSLSESGNIARSARPGRAALRKVSEVEAPRSEALAAGAPPPIHTRFVVDILSGTSAGGINAIYLAKALANNMSLDSLARMWITEADMKLLLNDKKVTPPGVRQDPPPSLLNSRWMYLKLLTALDAMNTTADPARAALVDDLDLFCTTTDLRGLPVEIALADESVMEQRYRNVYHFRRRLSSGGVQDFQPAMDPFLAFAARCTSSFPFAFEPMQLSDIPEIVNSEEDFRARYLRPKTTPVSENAEALFGSQVAALDGADRFADICSIYQRVDAADGGGGFANRPFGDGGYLDNKPFTYAIETIKKRHATLPVDRKLIYIEPAPESISEAPAPAKDNRPSAVENSMDALVVLPRYETIRQDIENVIHWNADISRLQRVLHYIDHQIEEPAHAKAEAAPDPLSNDTYLRLRLSGATDQIGCRLAEAMRVDPSSAAGEALRCIAGVWRSRNFGATGDQLKANAGLARYLDLFDFGYRERSIRFLRDLLQRLEDPTERGDALHKLDGIGADFAALAERQLALNLGAWKEHPTALECWKLYLAFITNPRFAALCLPPDTVNLEAMLRADDCGRDERVVWLFEAGHSIHIPPASAGYRFPDPLVPFAAIADYVAAQVISTYAPELKYAPGRRPPIEPAQGKTALQRLSGRMEELFDRIGEHAKALFLRQDVEIYPIVFGTTLGEFEPIQIFRISPDDTTPIAGTNPSGGEGSPPLRGASLDAFGAFLDRDWRLSDMLRGRLDGAERLITAVLPDSDPRTCKERERLIIRAQEEIAKEWVDFSRTLIPDRSVQKQRMIDEKRKAVENNAGQGAASLAAAPKKEKP